MKANDLMIGDKLRRVFNQKIVEVKEIKQSCIYTENNGYEYDEIEPIPITSEILEKNGFVANEHVYPYPYYEYINEKGRLNVGFVFPQGNKTSYKEPWVYIDSEYVFVVHLPCIYVHELQHTLRLCRIEKEIIL